MNAIVMTDRCGRQKYLSGLQFFCYGEKVISRYEDHPALAMPLDALQCEKLIPMLRFELPRFGVPAVVNGVVIPGVQFTVVPFPTAEQEVTE